jgi:hypothetical protein
MTEYINLALKENSIKLRVIPFGDGTYSLSTDASLALGDFVTVSGDVRIVAGTAVIGKLAANSGVDIGSVGVLSAGKTISQTPTISAAAIYASGDNVGGLLTFADAARAAAGGGIITNLRIIDDDKEKGNLELWLFNQTFTAGNDNAVWTPVEAELENLVCVIATSDGAWFDAANQSVAVVNAIKRYDLIGTSLFGRLVTRGTQTYTATDDLTVKLGMLQD